MKVFIASLLWIYVCLDVNATSLRVEPSFPNWAKNAISNGAKNPNVRFTYIVTNQCDIDRLIIFKLQPNSNISESDKNELLKIAHTILGPHGEFEAEMPHQELNLEYEHKAGDLKLKIKNSNFVQMTKTYVNFWDIDSHKEGILLCTYANKDIQKIEMSYKDKTGKFQDYYPVEQNNFVLLRGYLKITFSNEE